MPKRKQRNILLSLLFLFFPGTLLAQDSPVFKVVTFPEYNNLIYNETGWTGADGSFSVALSDSVTLWLYSDTWIGDITNGKHANATIINNSIGIQFGKNPLTAKLKYVWRESENGFHSAFITPKDSIGYFWLFDGIVINNKLYFVPIQVTSREGNGTFGFKIVGTWLAEVENPNEPPLDWRVEQHKIPFGNFSRKGNIFFGSALLRVGEFVYIYGCHEDWSKGRSGRSLIVARVEADQLTDFKQWQFYSNKSWTKDFWQIEKLFNGLAAEFSVSYMASIKKYVAVYTQNGLSDSIMVRFSETPVGPWDASKPIYECPEGKWLSSYFCYSAKAHPELSLSQDELIITYVCNSNDFWQLASDARIYWPRFLRITFSPY